MQLMETALLNAREERRPRNSTSTSNLNTFTPSSTAVAITAVNTNVHANDDELETSDAIEVEQESFSSLPHGAASSAAGPTPVLSAGDEERSISSVISDC